MYSVHWAVLELVCLIQEGRFGTVNDIVLYMTFITILLWFVVIRHEQLTPLL